MHGRGEKLYKVLVGKPEGKRPLGKPRRRWMNGIRMDLREFGLGGVDWIRLAQDRDQWQAVVSAVINLWVFCAMLRKTVQMLLMVSINSVLG
jgi:hypothetical protein